MKLKVIIADDEIFALRSLKYIIESHFENFEVIYCAKNGKEALEKTLLLKPDILIADIKMPLLNGIELVEKVREFCPTTYSIIVSGYQDFEYARGAIRAGVEDYLLKPVNINQLGMILNKLRAKKFTDYYYQQVNIIKMYIQGDSLEHLEKVDVDRYLPFNSYTAALVRKSSLPSRFYRKNTHFNKMPLWLNFDEGKVNLEDIKEFEGVWIIDGRDDEEFFIFRAECSSVPSLKEIVNLLINHLFIKYYTVVFALEPFQLSDSRNITKSLWRTLDSNLVLGLNQMLCLSEVEDKVSEDEFNLDNATEHRIKHFVLASMYDNLKQEIVDLLKRWEVEKRPQIWVENNVYQIITIITRCVALKPEIRKEIDFLLDEAFSLSSNYDDLTKNLLEVIEYIVNNENCKNFKIDSKGFFKLVEEYIKKNLNEQLSLELVCSRMGVSQTYLSRLFRKYTNMSFNEYVTMQRIEAAKRLMDTAQNDMTIQSIATAVGYNTPSYFSKVFREIVGVTPSEYLASRSANKMR